MKCLLLLALISVAFAQTQNCSRPIDIVFVLDESGSITGANFVKEKEFVRDYGSSFQFGPLFAKEGIVQFATVARLSLPMTEDKPTFVTKANALTQAAQNTCIGCGIKLAREEFGARGRGATSIMIVLTDGVNNVNTGTLQAEIDAAKNAGIVLVAIGVGSGISLTQLNQIASVVNGQRLVFVTDWTLLASVIDPLVQLVCVTIPPPPPVQECGNGKVEGTEQCDGGDCCATDCTFKPATTICRDVAGDCDVAEKCTGTSITCPADAFKAAATPCGEFFGLCDVRLENTCSGTNGVCQGPPAAPIGVFSPFTWEDFNVISFDGFKCHGGDVEGRLASRNTVDLSGFALGKELRVDVDGNSPHSLLVAGDATWTDGSIYPDGSAVYGQDFVGAAYVGGAFNAPADLLLRRSDPFDGVAAAAKFDLAQTYYTTIQTTLAALGENVAYSIQYGNGLSLVCTASSDVYHVKVSATDFNKVDWISLSGCKFSARWIVDITGTEDVTIKGQPFPAIVERVIYNVLGSGRTITGATGVAGHILGPRNTYFQTNGVTYGKVIVGNVKEARQNNKPNCKNFSPVVLSTVVLKPVQLGSTRIVVVDLANFIAGDLVCINGGCRKLVAASLQDIDGDGVLDHVFDFEDSFPSALTADTVMNAQVNATTGDSRVPVYNTVPNANTNPVYSSASKIAFAAFAVVLAWL